MALDGNALGAVLKSELSGAAKATNDAELTNFCNAIGRAIVEYVTANAVVKLDPTAQVTTGAGAGGTVVGTGKLS